MGSYNCIGVSGIGKLTVYGKMALNGVNPVFAFLGVSLLLTVLGLIVLSVSVRHSKNHVYVRYLGYGLSFTHDLKNKISSVSIWTKKSLF